MRVAYLDINDDDKIEMIIRETVEFLKNGKTIVYPTDTLYGLGCDAFNEDAVRKVYAIKKRSEEKPVSIMVKDIESIGKIAFMDRKNKAVVEKLLPGPFTFIFPGPKNIPQLITGGKNSIGIRIPDNKICRYLLESFANPIVTTSVNISGTEPLNDPFKIVDYFKNKEHAPDFILDCGKIKNAQPSIIIDLTQKNPQILRSGTRNLQEIKELLSKLSNIKCSN